MKEPVNDNIMVIFGIEVNAKFLTKEQFNNIINDLDVFVIDDRIYIGRSPVEMNDDESLYDFKSGIAEIIQDYLPDIEVDDIGFHVSLL
jgi:hypothetical protein